MTWSLKNADLSTLSIFAAEFGNGLFVVAGKDYNALSTSTDGNTWTRRSSGFNSDWVFGVGYGNGLWVICGLNGKLSTSTDGITWTARSSGVSTLLYDVHYANGLWVLVGDAGVCKTSTDGITWTTRNPSITTAIQSVSYGGGLWVCAGVSGKLSTSSNGTTWTSRISSFSTTAIACVFHNGTSWLASGDAGQIATSNDGISWTQRTSGFSGTISAITYAAGKWYIGGSSPGIRSSTDGFTWATESTPLVNPIVYAMATGAGIIVAVANDGQLAVNTLATPVTLTPIQGNITVTGQNFTRPYTDQTTQLIIAVNGLQPKSHLDTFKLPAVKASIAISGNTPDLEIGFASAPARQQISIQGLTPTFSNRLLYLITPGYVSTRYTCTLTGAADNLSDVLLPIKSFQTRFTGTYIYLSCIVPGIDAYQSAVDARLNGRLVIRRIYDYANGASESYVLASVPLDTFRLDSGGRSGVTATLSGNEYNTSVTPQNIALFDPVYFSQTNGSSRRYRCRLDPRVRVGDTVTVNGDSLIVDTIIHIVDTSTTIMEIAEA